MFTPIIVNFSASRYSLFWSDTKVFYAHVKKSRNLFIRPVFTLNHVNLSFLHFWIKVAGSFIAVNVKFDILVHNASDNFV
jgi:hypothetical protein